MATITFRLSQKKNPVGQSEIMMRFRHGDIDLYTRCNVFVFPQQWDNKKQIMVVSNIREPKLKTPQTLDEYRKKVADNTENTKKQAIIDEIKNKVITSFNSTNKKSIGKDWLSKIVNPEQYIDDEVNLGFFETFQLYLNKHQFPYSTEKGFNVLIRTLKRYELFKAETDRKNKDFHLTFESFDTDMIEDFESYIRNEHTLYKEYPKIFQKIKRNEYKPHARGNNTICAMMRRLRLFFNWSNKQGHTANNPFERYEGKPEKYGTPFYITIDERNIIADFDLSKHPNLERQRDIFIFQCCIGCRVSDLINLTKDNIINGAVEYIPHKTKDENTNVRVIRVPLNDRAAALVKMYADNKTGKLFPFITAQKYNDAIKEIFTICGIDRLVTVLNPITGNEEKKPLNEIASSHLARRTFVGNLYKQVKDPNLVGSLSGHVEGSKAFARYRNIDEDMKKELVKLID